MPSIYIGSTKIKNIYAGTTKIKKVYAGTTLVWSSQLISGVATNLTKARMLLAGANVGNYALFAGGRTGTSVRTAVPDVDGYDTNLVKSIVTGLAIEASGLGGGSNANYAMFGGGNYYDEGNTSITDVAAYNASLVRNIPAYLTNGGGSGIHALSSPSRVFFPRLSTLNYYNTDLTRGAISDAKAFLYDNIVPSLSGSGVYAIFAVLASAGSYSHAFNISSMVKTTITDLPDYVSVGANIGQYALFLQAVASNVTTANVYAYNNSLVLTTPIVSVATGRGGGIATSFGGYALFIGGNNTGTGSVTDAIDSNLVLSKTVVPALSTNRMDLASAKVRDNYVLIAGGYDYTNAFSTVNYYGY